jgi:hypothetical protein
MEFFSEGRKMVHSVPFLECLMKKNLGEGWGKPTQTHFRF